MGGAGILAPQVLSMDNADLEKLKISPGKLVPRFKAGVTEYSVTLASSVEEIKFSPLTSDSGASYTVKVSTNGSTNFYHGNRNFIVRISTFSLGHGYYSTIIDK